MSEKLKNLPTVFNEYYISKSLIKDIEKEYSDIILSAGEKQYKFKYNDEITIMRDNKELKIYAHEFNIKTDLLGI